MTIKVEIIAPFVKRSDGRYTVTIFRSNAILGSDGRYGVGFVLGNALSHFELEPDFDPNHPEPRIVKMRCIRRGSKSFDPNEIGEYDFSIWSYRGQAMSAVCGGLDSREDIPLAIESMVLRNDKALERMRREVDSLKRMEKIAISRRERIPDAVRIFVWQRDLGRCVKCGNSEKLEFDHIIPLSKGGSDTERNIQLLCEMCNRSKGASI